MALISSGVGWSGRDALNRAAMTTRRSLPAMSAVDGWALAVYQGARWRWPSTAAGSWPAVAYQMVVMAWQASWNGTVRSTARAVRLRACPVPKTCLASSIATSMLHRAAYRSMTCAAVAAVSVVTRARSYPAAERSRISTTVTGLVPNTAGHRQVTGAAEITAVLP